MLTANHHQVAHKAQVRDRSGLVKWDIDFLFKNGSFEQFTDDNEEANPENREDRMDDHNDEVCLLGTNTQRVQSIHRLSVTSLDLFRTRIRSIEMLFLLAFR